MAEDQRIQFRITIRLGHIEWAIKKIKCQYFHIVNVDDQSPSMAPLALHQVSWVTMVCIMLDCSYSALHVFVYC